MNWKAARVRLNGTVNVITFKLANVSIPLVGSILFKLSNDTAEQIYTFGIPIKK